MKTIAPTVLSKPESFQLINMGKDPFNVWRKDNPFTAINLSDTDFGKFDFSGFNLSGMASLVGHIENPKENPLVYLAGSTLRTLNDTLLVYADLSGANLEGASCNGKPGLGSRGFWGANLKGANLRNADFSWNGLSSANLAAADLEGTVFRSTEMENIVGLESANNVGLACWKGAQRLSPLNKAQIGRLVIMRLESSWQSCYDHWMTEDLASGKV